jgi:hypothetical protein
VKARLNLTIDDQLIERVKVYAEAQETSVSEIVEQYFIQLTSVKKTKNIVDLISQLDKPQIPETLNLKEAYYQSKLK